MDVLDQDCFDISELDLFDFLLKLASDRETLNETGNTDNFRDSPVQNAKIKKMNLVQVQVQVQFQLQLQLQLKRFLTRPAGAHCPRQLNKTLFSS
ncbi:hypothetical protein ACLKA7_003472 [Drosophila subpalustris]